jgi:hypothetical protein
MHNSITTIHTYIDKACPYGIRPKNPTPLFRLEVVFMFFYTGLVELVVIVG